MRTNYEKAVKLNEQFKWIESIAKRATPEQLEIVKKIRKRRSREDEMKIKDFADRLIVNRLNEIADAMPDEQYSMGSKIEVWFKGLKGVNDRRLYYSKSCKYRENHGYVRITLSFDELKNIKVIGGLVTYIYPSQKSNVKKCWWYDSKGKYSSFELIKKEGYIYKDYHSTTRANALKFGKQREEIRKAIAKADAIKVKAMAKALKQQYTYADSLSAGNCEAGTRAFCLRLGLDTSKKYRGRYILKLAEQKSSSSVSYVKRMIEYRARQISK